MANQKKRRHARYDRLFGAGVLLLCMILLISGITKCARNKKDSVETKHHLAEDVIISSEIADAQEQKNYSEVSVPTSKVHSGHMMLVNHAFPCRIDADAVKNGNSTEVQFVTIKSILDTKDTEIKPYTASDWEVGLDKVAALAMDKWFETFSQTTGHKDIRMIGGYKPEADDPDFQTGRTLTIGVFPETGTSHVYQPEGDYAWLLEHASEYGFVLRYPEGKEEYFDDGITERRTATFRYVGLAPAAYMAKQEICLEEFLQEIRHYSVSNMLTISADGKSYGMYFVPADMSSETTVFSVPSTQTSYDISGNNVDGFIITIYQS
ncbi:MAG: hypothetical protein IKI37_04765 [Oscillospiraceae bacterium]|nr:hypothetical protein [Oscillospiraceae bacterium]